MFTIRCSICHTLFTNMGYKAYLLSNRSISVYSTNYNCIVNINISQSIYPSRLCSCLLKELYCKVSHTLIGYMIHRPCNKCLKADNNGHTIIFKSTDVIALNKEKAEGIEITSESDLYIK